VCGVCLCARALSLSLSRRCSAHVPYLFFFFFSRFVSSLTLSERNIEMVAARKKKKKKKMNQRSPGAVPIPKVSLSLFWAGIRKNRMKTFLCLIQHPVFLLCVLNLFDFFSIDPL
jgi:hypothetical protein